MSATFEYSPEMDQADTLILRLIQVLAPESTVVSPEQAGQHDARDAFAPFKSRFRPQAAIAD